MKNIILIALLAISFTCQGQKNKTPKNSTKKAKEAVYQRLLELEKWYQSFADTISFSNEYSTFGNNSNELISDSLIHSRSILYLQTDSSKNIFDTQEQKNQKTFLLSQTSSPLFLGAILCKDFECQDLEHIIDPYLDEAEEVLAHILTDHEGNFYYKASFYHLLGYQHYEHHQKYFLLVRFKKYGKSFKVNSVEIQKK